MEHIKLNRDKVSSNLIEYEVACNEFNWEAAVEEFYGGPTPIGANIAYFAIDRHANSFDKKNKIAIRCRSLHRPDQDISYRQLQLMSDKFCDVLSNLGVRKGDPICIYLPRRAELFYCFYGALKLGAVCAPIFSAFGATPVRDRLEIGGIKTIVTTTYLFQKRLENSLDEFKFIERFILVDLEEDRLDSRIYSYTKLMQIAQAKNTSQYMQKEDRALLHFTSGTTGKPKAVVHVHEAAVAHYYTSFFALDLRHSDVYWCTADPGWVTGVSYGLIAPLLHGATSIVDEEEFDVSRWYQIIQKEKVNVWYTAPTAIRMMMRMGSQLASDFDFSSVRLMGSVGEPLNPSAIDWGQKSLRLCIHDNWWQTETGCIVVSNFRSMNVKRGSMGRALPGMSVAVVRRDEQGNDVIECKVGEQGEIAIRYPWPSMFRSYLNLEDRYRSCFVGQWYLSGDLATMDEDGYFWFLGRSDDVIKSAGHLIGPFELENVLTSHPSVIEAAVIGIPDPLLYETVKAFVVLSNEENRSNEVVEEDILGFIKKKVGSAIAPRQISIVKSLPHTRSGKIMRRLLKARELSLPEGDLSTLEKSDFVIGEDSLDVQSK